MIVQKIKKFEFFVYLTTMDEILARLVERRYQFRLITIGYDYMIFRGVQNLDILYISAGVKTLQRNFVKMVAIAAESNNVSVCVDQCHDAHKSMLTELGFVHWVDHGYWRWSLSSLADAT